MIKSISKRLVVVSNRLPVAIFEDEHGGWEVRPGTGGLVTALEPIVKSSGGLWIGWAGCNVEVPAEELLRDYSEKYQINLVPVSISEDEIEKSYRGYSNRTIWPLFHDMLGQFSFDLREFETYKSINRRFAAAISERIGPDDICWIHDYQLIFVGRYFRERNQSDRLNYFLHIPFPSLDLFRRLPKNDEIMRALLEYDHLGFQTAADRRNFIACVKWIVPDASVSSRGRQAIVSYKGRKIKVGYYPISIDFDEFNQGAHSKEAEDAAWFLRENLAVEILTLGLDRLDYTKGIRERFLAFERLLEKHPELVGRISLLQIVVPSRLNVPDYRLLKQELDLEAGRINSTYSQHGWVPILYEFRTLNRPQLLGYYKASDIALITPVRDGMNLVSKEYCAACIDEKGVLILSKFAGAAAQLSKGALLVNPFDYDESADAIYEASIMSEEEKQSRMRLMRADVRRNNVHRWVRWFFGEEQ